MVDVAYSFNRITDSQRRPPRPQRELFRGTAPLSRFHIEATPSVTFKPHANSPIREIVELRDGTVISCSDDRTAKRWSPTLSRPDSNEWELLQTYQHQTYVFCAIELDDDTLVTGSEDLKVWSKHTGECLHTFEVGQKVLSLLKLSASRQPSFVHTTRSGELKKRRASDFEPIGRFSGHKEAVGCLCELADGTIVSGSIDHTLKRWDVNTEECIMTFEGHMVTIRSIVELNKGQRIVSAAGDGTMRVWDLSSGECLRVLKNPLLWASNGTVVVASSDGFNLLNGSYGSTIQVWNMDLEGNDFISTCDVGYHVLSLRLLKKSGSIVVGGLEGQMEVRETWISVRRRNLIEWCCMVIAHHLHRSEFDTENLKQCLPNELYELVLQYC